ncbi:MAG: hypothetical protein JNL10_16510 [Verrucomicrobiales bacterium]|nr:hypothetical protein [Verrucomicrobiales bacterium]
MKDHVMILETLLHRRLDCSLRHDDNVLPFYKAVKQEDLARSVDLQSGFRSLLAGHGRTG